MGGGVSLSLSNAAGKILREEARKHVPLKIGDVAVTSAGTLAARYVFHSVTIDYTNMVYPSEESIQVATLRCLQLSDALGVKSIAFPALGTGVGGFPLFRAATVMTRTIADYLMGKTNIDIVTICLHGRSGMVKEHDLDLFYEQAVALASVYAQSKHLSVLMSELEATIGKLNKPDLLIHVSKLKKGLQNAQDILSEAPKNREQSIQIQVNSGIERISEQVVAISSGPQDADMWADKQLEAEVLRLKLSGLYTQLNIQTGNLNHLEEEKAKYATEGIPNRLLIAINDINNEIESIEVKIKETGKKLATLVPK